MDVPGVSPYPEFLEACAVCPPRALAIRAGNTSVMVKVAGDKLAQRLFDPILHVSAAPSAAPPDITICAWSVEETGVAAPTGVLWSNDLPLEWIAPGGRLMVSCLPGADELPRVSIARPFQWSLVPLLASRGLYASHGGLIASRDNGAGLLLVGPNGSGKSTTCLAAVQNGFRMVGEDFLAVETEACDFIGHSLYASCNVTPFTRERFSNLPARAQFPFDAPPDGKSILVFTPDISPNPMLRSAPVRALVFPVVSEQDDTEIRPLPKGEAYRRLVPVLRQAKKLTLAGRRAHHDALMPLASHLPAFQLSLGRDVACIATCLSELSETLA